MSRPALALIGAGRLAAHLALALQAIGRTPVALGARNPARAEPLAARLGLRPCRPQQVLQALKVDWVFLCVRDEAIAEVAARLPWAGQLAVHASGATGLEALAPAQQRAGFHPLQLFADPLPTPEQALAAFQGVRVGIEGDSAPALGDLAQALGAVPLRLGEGQRPRYHAAANLAASGLFAPLQLAVQLWQQALGLGEAEALQALLPLARGALTAADRVGLAGALSGPMARGDASVLAAHLQAMDAVTRQRYREVLQALLPLAERAGRLDAEALARLRAVTQDHS